MVFRKPYAILIKNFKLMHLILTICCVYLIIKTSAIINFLGGYLSSTDSVVGQDIVGNLYSGWMFILPILIIIFLVVLLAVMIVKEKPKTFYVVNIIVYIAILILYFYGKGILTNMEKELVDTRTLKSLYDFFVYAMLFQGFTIVISSIRAIGFDIKKFDFGKDLQQLDVSSEDNEEFEVSIDFDFHDVKRKAKKRFRHMKYVYLEHKKLINLIAVVVILVFGLFIYKNSSISIKKYSEGKRFSMNGFSMVIEESYLVNTDYRGNKLGTNLLVLKLNVKSTNKYEKEFTTGALELLNGDLKYHHTAKYQDKLKDLGISYNKQLIGNTDTHYVLVYDVGKKKPKDIKLQVSNVLNEDFVYVKLSYVDLTTTSDTKEFKIGDEATLSNSTLKNTTLKIDSYEIADQFTINYDFCDNKNNCLKSIEYIRPDYYNTNYDKTLLKLKGSITTENSNIKDMYDLISTYGRLEYTINGETKTQNVEFKRVKSLKANYKNTYYIEILKEIKDADSINLVFGVRSNTYKYKIK